MKISDTKKILLLFALCFALALYSAMTGQNPTTIGSGKTPGQVLGTQTSTVLRFPDLIPHLK